MPNHMAFEPLAITGFALRLPDANNKERYWQNLIAKKNSIKVVSATRQKLARRPNWSSKFGQLENIDSFDYEFFNMSYDTAKFMDPQQRLTLELAYETLEDAGMITNNDIDERPVGVYISNCMNSYNKLVIDYIDEHGKEGIGSEYLLGCLDSAITSRITHYFNFTGPAYHVNSACSSFMVQVDVASKDLHRGNVEGALVIAANLMATDFICDLTETAGIISSGDCCSVFDANADGTIVGEGLVGIYLERQSDALKNNRNIYGLIAGIGVNNDGFALSVTSPNPKRQYQAMKLAYDHAQLDPNVVSYIEAHGTGTVIGDPIELNALAKLFNAQRQDKVGIGAAKTNVGHLLGAAGGVGLAKVLLSLQHKTIAPSINLEVINPNLELDKTPFKVITEATPWHADTTRYAGINCFGIGGTNTHAIVKEFDQKRPITINELALPYIFSAKCETALNTQIQNLSQLINQQEADRASIKATLNRYRKHYPYRAYGVFTDGGLTIVARAQIKSKVAPKVLLSIADIAELNNAITNGIQRIKLLYAAMGKRVQLSAVGSGQAIADYIAGHAETLSLTANAAVNSLDTQTQYRHKLKLTLTAQGITLVGEASNPLQFSLTEDHFANLIGELTLRGVALNWEVLHPDGTFNIQSLPNYPFKTNRVWIRRASND